MILGASTVGVLTLILLSFINLVLDPFLRTVSGVEGDAFVTVTEERVHGLLAGLAVISSILFAFFAGGFVAGRRSPSAELNGAVMAGFMAAVPFVWLLGSLAFVFLEPAQSPDDVYTRSEGLRMLFAALMAYCVAAPVLVLAGFWGGRIGGRTGRASSGAEANQISGG